MLLHADPSEQLISEILSVLIVLQVCIDMWAQFSLEKYGQIELARYLEILVLTMANEPTDWWKTMSSWANRRY